mmetsp:Transcript_10890/g.16598  ORF Transcript_10890/g.16598 Transcript_10890/m.16598 type:complete len:151 (-) Transcript_10890:1131-1583(-)
MTSTMTDTLIEGCHSITTPNTHLKTYKTSFSDITRTATTQNTDHFFQLDTTESSDRQCRTVYTRVITHLHNFKSKKQIIRPAHKMSSSRESAQRHTCQRVAAQPFLLPNGLIDPPYWYYSYSEFSRMEVHVLYALISHHKHRQHDYQSER